MTAVIDRTTSHTSDVEVDRLRERLADACRVMAARDLAPGILGHISMRLEQRLVAVRCRGPRERGLGYTTPDDIRVLEVSSVDQAEPVPEYVPPFELPLHLSVLRRRPDVDCVAHAHPTDVVAADLAGVEVRPIVGAFDIPGAHLARAGIPIYPRSVLVHDERLGDQVARHLGAQPAVVMRGHGLTVVGGSAEETVLRGVSINRIAALSLAVLHAGGQLIDISEQDAAELPDLGSALNLAAAWRHELARVPRAG